MVCYCNQNTISLRNAKTSLSPVWHSEVLCVTWIPTRRCNLTCPQCAVGKYRTERELTIGELAEAFENVTSLLGNQIFHIILGGEPTLLPLGKLIPKLNQLNLNYAINSNCVALTRKRARRLASLGLKNWSVSIDSFKDPRAGASFQALSWFKDFGVQDLHCMITMARSNWKHAVPLTILLSKMEVWVEHTIVHFAKSPAYDFASTDSFVDRFLPEDRSLLADLAEELTILKQEGFLVHNTFNWFKAWELYAGDLNWKCKSPKVLVVDSDGSLKPCLHLRGNWTRRLNVLTGFRLDDWFWAWEKDTREQCLGCFWDCLWELENGDANWFQHQG